MAFNPFPNTYNPVDVKLIIAGIEPTDYAPGTKIAVSKSENNILPSVGVDGEVSLAVNQNRTGMLTFSLKNTSSFNAGMAAYQASVGLGTPAIFFPVAMSDPSSGLSIETFAWYEVQPDLSFSQEIDQLDYVLGLVDSTFKVLPGQAIAESIIGTVSI